MGRRLALFVLLIAVQAVAAEPSPVERTIATVIERFRTTVPADTLAALRQSSVVSRLTRDERRILATEYCSFTVDKPAVVTMFRYVNQRVPPYWLREQDFERMDEIAVVGNRRFEARRKPVPAGRVGLGINSFADDGGHYFAVVTPQTAGDSVAVSGFAPKGNTVGPCEIGQTIYTDARDRIVSFPESIRGGVVVRAFRGRAKASFVIRLFRKTDTPSSERPDQVVLTWSEDPRTTQTVQWRNSPSVNAGAVKYLPANAQRNARWTEVSARRTELPDKYLLNDPVVARFSATIRGLAPGTKYAYRVGNPATGTWSALAELTTAPAGTPPFSFIYTGDAPYGLAEWGELLRGSLRRHSDVDFYVTAGDNVGRGNERDDWDRFFAGCDSVYNRRQVAPSMGNHEYQGGNGPWTYVRLFTLPENGPVAIPDVSTYQYISIDGNRLSYRACRAEGPAIDEFVIEK